MEDRFRFRVWSKKDNRMIYNAEDVYDGFLSGWCGNKNNNNDGWISCFGEYLGRDEDYVVMQSNGIKDINGKLIYERDIVVIKHITPRGDVIEKICEVTFSHCTFWAKYNGFSTQLFNDDCIYTVIGNIYEKMEG